MYSKYPPLQRDVALAQRQFDQFGILLISGPSGCGKTHFARFLHRQTTWQNGPYVEQPAASLSQARFESDMFGHVKGAFSGAVSQHRGLVGAAQHGVLCVESIEDLGLENQARLLRFLETRRYRALGATQEQQFEGGLLLTSRFHPKVLRARDQLRDDFFYRVQQAVLEMPPAHWREADFISVFETLHGELAKQFQTSPDKAPYNPATAKAALIGKTLAGGYHTLFNLLSQAWLRQTSPQAILDQQDTVADEGAAGLPDTGSLQADLEALEKALLLRALQRFDGTRTELAKRLGLSRRALMYKLAHHGLREKDA